MARIFRILSYLYHLIFALYLVGLAIAALTSNQILNMPFLPWSGPALTQWLLWGGILGILSIVLAVTGIFRYLFPLWTLTMLVVLVRGFLIKPYSFDDRDFFFRVLWLIAGALVSFLASLTLLWLRRRRA